MRGSLLTPKGLKARARDFAEGNAYVIRRPHAPRSTSPERTVQAGTTESLEAAKPHPA
jgi:hypothetical protein